LRKRTRITLEAFKQHIFKRIFGLKHQDIPKFYFILRNENTLEFHGSVTETDTEKEEKIANEEDEICYSTRDTDHIEMCTTLCPSLLLSPHF
jgi:hypothetical protein